MFEPTGEQSRKVLALASRLRLVQAELADERDEVRQEQLDSEIERALAAVQPGERDDFLQELLRNFPGGAVEPGKPKASGPVAPSGPSIPKDPAAQAEFAGDLLAKAWGSLSAEQKKSLGAKLVQGGIAPAPSAGGGGGALPEGVVRDLRGKLQLGSTESPDAARVAELAAMSVDFVMGVDRLVWGMWTRKISPMSAIRANGPMQRFMREYVTGKIDPLQSGTGGPTGDLRRLLEMTVAVVSALGQAGTTFGDRFVSQFSPGAIEETVGEGGFRNKDAECWKKYKEVGAKLDRASIDAEITQSVARFVEDWMKRAGR